MRWPLTFYTDRFVPDGFAGCARGPVIFIRPKYKDDYGIYRHELEHVLQWLTSLSFHSILYLLSDTHKLESEVEAYQEQAKHYPDDRLPLYAKFISTRYGLDVSEADALHLLRTR